MTTYEKIKTLRTQLRLSQDELARLTGYSDRSSIAKIESGRVDLTESKIVSFAQALGVSPSYLMGLSDDMPSPVPAPALTGAEQHLLDNFRDLNPDGQDKLIDYSDDLVLSGRYSKTPSRSTSSAAPDK